MGEKILDKELAIQNLVKFYSAGIEVDLLGKLLPAKECRLGLKAIFRTLNVKEFYGGRNA